MSPSLPISPAKRILQSILLPSAGSHGRRNGRLVVRGRNAAGAESFRGGRGREPCDGLGWLSSQRGKALLDDACADAFRNKETGLHGFATLTQLSSVDGSTLRAPDSENDYRAISFALACAARR